VLGSRTVRGSFAPAVVLFLSCSACSGSQFSTEQGTAATGDASAGAGGHDAGVLGNGGSSGRSSGGDRGSGGRLATGGSLGAGGGTMGTGGTTSTGGATTGGAGGLGRDAGHAGSTSTGGGSGGTVDAGPPVLTACPVSPPDPRSTVCAGSLTCSYGDDPRPSCRTVYRCVGGKLVEQRPNCDKPKSCFVDESPLPVINKPCDPVGEFCIWDSGLSCSCIPCTSTSGCTGNAWTCAPAAATPCPLSPPNEGQPCDPSGAVDCQYAACPLPTDLVAHCAGGIWSWDVPVCQ